jgi:hypothetical protein
LLRLDHVALLNLLNAISKNAFQTPIPRQPRVWIVWILMRVCQAERLEISLTGIVLRNSEQLLVC